VRGIYSVNNRMTGAVFTPQREFNLYVIDGCQFGEQRGEVCLYGHFQSQVIKMNVEFWSDDKIVAAVDANVSGELDQDNVTLVVRPVRATEMQKGGFKFYAARESVLLGVVPSSQVLLSTDISKGVQYVSPVTDAGGWTTHVAREREQDRLYPGVDVYDFSDLAPGFAVESVAWGTVEISQDMCNRFVYGPTRFPILAPGQINRFGKWDVQGNGKKINVSYQVLECKSPDGNDANGASQPGQQQGMGGVIDTIRAMAPVMDSSYYWLAVYVTGPRGIQPR
jgi:hypothetical protein